MTSPADQTVLTSASATITGTVTNSLTSVSGISYSTPLAAFAPSVVLGENGNDFMTDGTSVAAFDQLGGTTQWTYTPSAGVDSIIDAVGGGVNVLDQVDGLPPQRVTAFLKAFV